MLLTSVTRLVAEGRLSSRRAAVITYAMSLIIRGLALGEQKPSIAFPDEDEPASESPFSATPNGQSTAVPPAPAPTYSQLRT
jgi:hypothetical protein